MQNGPGRPVNRSPVLIATWRSIPLVPLQNMGRSSLTVFAISPSDSPQRFNHSGQPKSSWTRGAFHEDTAGLRERQKASARTGGNLPHVSGRASAIINRRRRVRRPKIPDRPRAPIEVPMRPKRKTPELSLRGSFFHPIELRSEVTGDPETASEAVAFALPCARDEHAVVEDGSDKPAWPVLGGALIHQLEVEVQVGDRVPAEVGADDPAGGVRRYRPVSDELAEAAEARSHEEAGGAAAGALVVPLDAADRAQDVGVELRRPVVLKLGRHRPGSRLRPSVGNRIEERVLQVHRLAVPIDLAVLAPHAVHQTRVPHRILAIGAGEQESVARAEPAKVPLHAGVDGPADLVLRCVARDQDTKAAIN